MKFGVLCIIYNDHEYLETALIGMAPAVDKVLILINSNCPYHGQIEDNAPTLQEAYTLSIKFPNVVLQKTEFDSEVDQRNYGLAQFCKEGYDYVFIMDGDEIYSRQSVFNMQGFISANLRYDAFHVEWDTYWKKSYRVIRPREKYTPVVAVNPSRFAFTKIREGTTSVIRSGDTVVRTNSKEYNGILIPPQIAICHHMSYSRTDVFIKKKLEHATPHLEFLPDWYEKIWLNWKDGDTNLHPITPSQYQTAVKADFLSMPEQLVYFIKKERMIKNGCTIIIPNWNSKTFLEKCLKQIDTRTSGVKFKVIVVENGSDKDDSVEYLKGLVASQPFSYPLEAVFNKENLGFAGGINAGIKKADPLSDICLLNVDAEPQPGWLSALYETLLKFPDAGMVGPLGNIVHSGHQAEGQFQEDVKTLNLHFFCVLISRFLIDKIGLLDPLYKIGGYDDNDYGSRARFAKIGLYISANSLVKHEAHQVFNLNGLNYYDYDGQNLFRFANKYHQILHAISQKIDLYADPVFAKEAGLLIE